MAIDFSFPPEIDELRLKVRDLMDTVVRPTEEKAKVNDWSRRDWVGAILEMRVKPATGDLPL